MNADIFDDYMRAFEVYHNQVVPPDHWVIFRLDGKAFHTFTKNMNKPFDERFGNMMAATTEYIVRKTDAVYGYTESDEISILLPYTFDGYARKVEKLNSLFASYATTGFINAYIQDKVKNTEVITPESLVCDANFDSRIIVFPNSKLVMDYFRWRQSDAARCCINSVCHWTMIQNEKVSASKATSFFKGKGFDFKNEWLFQQGINFNDYPERYKRGIGIYWETYEREGFDPILETPVKSLRRKLVANASLPMGDAYEEFITKRVVDKAFKKAIDILLK